MYTEALVTRSGMRSGLVAFWGLAPDELQKAERDARRAEALRPNAGQTVLAFVHDQLGRWVEAEREYQVALATVDRTNPIALDSYSLHLRATGRMQAALVQATEAYRLAPADSRSVGSVGRANLILGHDTEALKFADLLVALGDHVHANEIYGAIAVRRGLAGEALARSMSSLSESEREVIRLIVLAAADPAKAPEARKALAEFTRLQQGISPLIVAYTEIGALDEAYGLANRALDEHSQDEWIGVPPTQIWGPEMRPFRRDARFQRLVTRLRLIDYWKQYGPPDDCDLHGDTLVCR
jgi:tetratricopeptide (TPR) repeat protein